LGGAPRLQTRDHRLSAGGGGGPQERDVHRDRRVRIRAAFRRGGRPTARPQFFPLLRPPPAYVVCVGVCFGRAARGRRHAALTTRTFASIPIGRAGRAASTSTSLPPRFELLTFQAGSWSHARTSGRSIATATRP